jgi:hypothetical protein
MVLITLTFLPFTAPFATFDWGAPLANSLCSGERQVSFANGRADESGAEVTLASNPLSRVRLIASVLKILVPQSSTIFPAFTAATFLRAADSSHEPSTVLRI